MICEVTKGKDSPMQTKTTLTYEQIMHDTMQKQHYKIN